MWNHKVIYISLCSYNSTLLTSRLIENKIPHMVEKIGSISDSLPMSPDVYLIDPNKEALDAQVRFLENSGIADYLGLAVEVMPGASFYYTEKAAVYSGSVLPGYILLGREQERPLTFARAEGVETFAIGLTLTPNVQSRQLEATHTRRGIKFVPDDPRAQSIWRPYTEYFNPGFSTAVNDKKQMVLNVFEYIDHSGLVPLEDKSQVITVLAKRTV